jgi:hypothetical protein
VEKIISKQLDLFETNLLILECDFGGFGQSIILMRNFSILSVERPSVRSSASICRSTSMFVGVDLVRITPLGTVKDPLLLQDSHLITLKRRLFPKSANFLKIDLGHV